MLDYNYWNHHPPGFRPPPPANYHKVIWPPADHKVVWPPGWAPTPDDSPTKVEQPNLPSGEIAAPQPAPELFDVTPERPLPGQASVPKPDDSPTKVEQPNLPAGVMGTPKPEPQTTFGPPTTPLGGSAARPGAKTATGGSQTKAKSAQKKQKGRQAEEQTGPTGSDISNIIGTGAAIGGMLDRRGAGTTHAPSPQPMKGQKSTVSKASTGTSSATAKTTKKQPSAAKGPSGTTSGNQPGVRLNTTVGPPVIKGLGF